MEIRHKSSLPEAANNGNVHLINQKSPELIFITALAEGQPEKAMALFTEEKLFGGKSAVDAPYGRYEGLEKIRECAEGFLATFHAERAWVTPIVQTRANGRAVSEVVVSFVVDGMINETSMFVVGDLKTQDTLDEVRFYCHFSHVPGLTPYRKPIFVSAHKEAGDPNLLTGAVREYYEALHHMPHVEPARILKTMQPGCAFGGYEPFGTKAEGHTTQEELEKAYNYMATYIPKWVSMRYETIIDDGVNCVIEWQHIVSDMGREQAARVAISGVSSYERGKDGLLCSIRISDYAGYERQIDWTKTPLSKEEAYSVNAVDVMSGMVGCKVL